MFELFSKFKKGLTKTTQKFFGIVGGLFGFTTIDTKSLETLEEALYIADFGVQTTQEILDAIKAAHKTEKTLRGQDAALIAKTVLKQTLAGADIPFKLISTTKPEVICLIGVNGAGKTTTIAKLAALFQSQDNRVIIGACDTFRAAANEQITVWAERLQVPIVTSHQGADAAAVAFDTYQSARAKQFDIVLLDTAGRLHTKSNLMEELHKIKRVLKKQNNELPHHSWLVIDGSLGSNSIEQAKRFHQEFGLTGIIITKLDGTSRGGALVGIYRELQLPIYFIALGEKETDLKPFSVEQYVDALFESN